MTIIAQQLSPMTSATITGPPTAESPGFNADYAQAVATLMPILIIAFVIQLRMGLMGSRAVRDMRTIAGVFGRAVVTLVAVGPLTSIFGEAFVLEILSKRESGGVRGEMLTVFIVVALISLLVGGFLLAFDQGESGDKRDEDL